MTQSAESVPPVRLPNACRNCGDCYHPTTGPNADGDPCEWCRDCGCPAAGHTRMTQARRPLPDCLRGRDDVLGCIDICIDGA